MQKENQPGFNLNLIYVLLPIAIVLGLLIYIEIGRKKEHRALLEKHNSGKISALRDYVAANLKKGYSKEQIRNALLKSGYTNQRIFIENFSMKS
jgi:cytochrome c-type biogenesis protein CcmH/NrfF